MMNPDLLGGASFAVEADFFNWLRNWDWDWTDIWSWSFGIAQYHITAYGIWGYIGVFATIYVALYAWDVTRPFINLTNAFVFRAIASAITTVVTTVGGGALTRAWELFISMTRRLAAWVKELLGEPRG